MFYDVFKKLCNENGETPNAVCLKLGYSQAAAPYWKKTGNRPKREALEKIAEYFHVTIDYLLEREPVPVIPAEGQKKNAPVVIDRGELFKILSELTDAELDELLRYAEYLLSKR